MADLRLQTAWNSRDANTIAEAYTPDGVRHQIPSPEERFEGRDAIRETVGAIVSSWPDCTLDVRGLAVADDVATVEWTFTGTFTNDFGPVPANGEVMTLHGVSVCQMEGELIREERVCWDGATLLAAAGVLPG